MRDARHRRKMQYTVNLAFAHGVGVADMRTDDAPVPVFLQDVGQIAKLKSALASVISLATSSELSSVTS